MSRGSLVVLAALASAQAAACSVVAGLGPPRTLAPGTEGGPSGDDLADAAALEGAPGSESSDASDATGPADAPGDVLDESDARKAVQPVGIAVGPERACAIVEAGPGSPDNGTVRCWGSNAGGELGRDPAQVASTSVPLPVSGGSGPAFGGVVTQLSLATGYGCATVEGGYLSCWGRVPADPRLTPEPSAAAYAPSVMDLDGHVLLSVVSAAAAPAGGCATDTAGALVCWGSIAPTAVDAGVTLVEGGVATVDSFTTVVAGRAHACGVHAGTGVECWGANDKGQCGVGAGPVVSAPELVAVTAPVAGVASGADTTCAVTTQPEGAVYCWGSNDRHQLGDAVTGAPFSTTPVRVNVPSAVAVAVGDGHACALASTASNGNVWCWGDDSDGQLGAGPAGAPVTPGTPVKVQRIAVTPGGAPRDLQAAQHLAAGGQTTCVTWLGNTNVWCWGANASGQAGQPSGSTVAYATPVGW